MSFHREARNYQKNKPKKKVRVNKTPATLLFEKQQEMWSSATLWLALIILAGTAILHVTANFQGLPLADVISVVTVIVASVSCLFLLVCATVHHVREVQYRK